MKMYTTTWCTDCMAVKRILIKKGISFEEIDIEKDSTAADHVMRINGGKRSVPTLVCGDEVVGLSPVSRELLEGFLSRCGFTQ